MASSTAATSRTDPQTTPSIVPPAPDSPISRPCETRPRGGFSPPGPGRAGAGGGLAPAHPPPGGGGGGGPPPVVGGRAAPPPPPPPRGGPAGGPAGGVRRVPRVAGRREAPRLGGHRAADLGDVR